MEEVIVFESEKNEQIFVEVENAEYLQDELVSDADRTIKKTTKKFEDVLSSVKTIAKSTYNSISLIPNRPDEVVIEFGLKISGDISAVITSTSAEGHIKVTLKWSGINNKKEEPQQDEEDEKDKNEEIV